MEIFVYELKVSFQKLKPSINTRLLYRFNHEISYFWIFWDNDILGRAVQLNEKVWKWAFRAIQESGQPTFFIRKSLFQVSLSRASSSSSEKL